MSESNGELGAFLAGFVIGGLVGAATALLLAPQSGSETWSQLTNKSEELRHEGESRVRHARARATSYAHEYRQRAQEVGETVQEQARIVLDAGKRQAGEVKSQAEASLEQAKESVQEVQDTVETAAKNVSNEETSAGQ